MISDSFPPIYEKNNEINKLQLKIHRLLKKSKCLRLDKNSLKISNILKEKYLNYIKIFHKELFPIIYQDLYYERLLSNQYKILILKGNAIFYQKQKPRTIHRSKLKRKSSYKKIKKKLILGFLTYRYERCKFPYLKFKDKFKYFFNDFLSSHIMTFGILKEFRQNKLGSYLFNIYIREMKKFNIKYLILELAEYNYSALNFYYKIGFINQELVIGMYEIYDKVYNGIVMKLYLN